MNTHNFFQKNHHFIPFLSQSEALELEKKSLGQSDIVEKLLIENAGKASSELVLDCLKKMPARLGKIILVVGPGNNGADAIACARHLLTQNLELLIFLPPKSSKHSKYLDSELELMQDAIKKQHD